MTTKEKKQIINKLQQHKINSFDIQNFLEKTENTKLDEFSNVKNISYGLENKKLITAKKHKTGKVEITGIYQPFTLKV